MKIAVYTISKNEEKHAEKFMQHCRDADLVVIGDTGSTDDTTTIIQDNGGHVVNVTVSPWRFDTARNTVLSLLPSDIDICLALDLDEFIMPGWRDKIEAGFDPEKHTRVKFCYIHNFNPDGTYRHVAVKDFFHCRHDYLWQHRVHELLYYYGKQETIVTLPDITVEHRQDMDKSRKQYLQLLEVEAKDKNTTPRHIFWLGREYTIHSRWAEAVQPLMQFVDMPDTWNVEVSHAYRYLAKALSHLNLPNKALVAHLDSVRIASDQREPWVDLSWYHYFRKEWAQAYVAAKHALTITQKQEHYLISAEAWGYKIYELAATCAMRLNLQQEAIQLIKRAIAICPDNPHLMKTADWIGATWDE